MTRPALLSGLPEVMQRNALATTRGASPKGKFVQNCRKSTMGVAVVTALISLLPISHATADESGDVATYRNVNANLIERFQSNGTDPADIAAVLDRLEASELERRDPTLIDTQIAYGPGHWVYEWVELGNASLVDAGAALDAGNAELALESYLEAAQHFNVAKFPYVRDADYVHYEAAYNQARAAYEEAGALFATPLEVVDVEFRGEQLRAYLHLPADLSAPVPLVVGSGGIDVFATELLSTARRINEEGIAFLNVELPGVGNSNALISTPDHEEIYLATLAAVDGDPRLDFERLGGFATSWGGECYGSACAYFG